MNKILFNWKCVFPHPPLDRRGLFNTCSFDCSCVCLFLMLPWQPQPHEFVMWSWKFALFISFKIAYFRNALICTSVSDGYWNRLFVCGLCSLWFLLLLLSPYFFVLFSSFAFCVLPSLFSCLVLAFLSSCYSL